MPTDVIEGSGQYIKEGDLVDLQFFSERPIGILLPKNVPLKVSYTENAIKGDIRRQ